MEMFCKSVDRVVDRDQSASYGHRPQLFSLYSSIIHSSMNLFSQHTRQFILSFFQVVEA